MLFRPYRPIYLGKRRLPFTPGLIPSNQDRLARRIADTIMGSLLTPEELENLAKRLLQPERVQSAIFWLLQMALDQLRPEKDEKTAKILANILHDLLSDSMPRLIKAWARRPDFLEAQINQVFDQVLLELQLSDAQANQLAQWILNTAITPDVVRQGIIDFLTDRNIQVIDEGFREKTSGTYWVVANLFGVRNTLVRLRTYCLDEKDESNARLADLIEALKIRERLRDLLKNLSLQNLPVLTVRQLRRTLRDSIRHYLRDRGADLLLGLGQSIDWDEISVLILNRLRNSSVMNTSLETVSKELALILERYLEEDLERIMTQVIPILDLDQVISDRVKATSPAELESAIQGIVRNELQAIVNLGGILGVVIGLIQTLSLLAR